MPIYEYKCPNGHVFEYLALISEAGSKRKCPRCGRMATRFYSAPPIHFKGGGFYNTDYKNKREHGSKDTGTKEGRSAQEVKSDADKKSGDGPPSASTKAAGKGD